MKLKLIDISRSEKCPRAEKLLRNQSQKEEDFTLVSVFDGGTLVDLDIYKELLIKPAPAVPPRLTKRAF